MKLGEKIREARIKKGLTQLELAEMTQTSKQNIYKYETSLITNIPLDRLEKIANVLDVSPSYLIGWEEEKKENTKEKQTDEITFDDFTYAFYNETKELSEEDKKTLLEMAKIFKKRLDNKN